jgi:putative ATP-dependent endonuclease of OLD family
LADIKTIQSREPEKQLQEQSGQLSLPGYMLLIDEPEIALHPGAVRAASRYLYGLADDPAWQVMMTTHSPAFINPLHDHTTVVRLDRSHNNPSPRTYRSDSVDFLADDKEKLKMLNRFDQGLTEMFFGQYPIVIEGDTEFAAFETVMRLCAEEFPVQKRPVLVRARGKWTMPLIIKMLRHFKVPFSLLHDSDSPCRSDGKGSGTWTANLEMHNEISEIRKAGVRVVHRISIPNFEYVHLPLEIKDGTIVEIPSEDKPWNLNEAVIKNEVVRNSVKALLKELISTDASEEPFAKQFEIGLREAVSNWAAKNAPKDGRYVFK